MKTAAVIAEFNPFHNGHKYLCDTIKKEYGIDHCIAIMSGDFVQRGDTAIINKHARAELAVKAGFSAVFELPLFYATSSAPDFAYGGVSIADALGVDYLFFGSESGDTATLEKTADFLLSPSQEFDLCVKTHVKAGNTYAKALSLALKECKITESDFSAPNDILALEYIKSLKKSGSATIPLAVKRLGVDHDSTDISGNIASATQLRKMIKSGDFVSSFVPVDLPHPPLFIEDFMGMLNYRLHYITEKELLNTPGISSDLAHKIIKNRHLTDYRNLIDAIKSKNFSESSIRRAFIHILLNMQKDEALYPDGHLVAPSSVRLLAMSKEGADAVRFCKEHGNITIFTKPRDILDKGDALLTKDMEAADLYEKVYSSKYSSPYIADCSKSPVIIWGNTITAKA